MDHHEGKSTVGRHGGQGERDTYLALFIAFSSLLDDAGVPFSFSVIGIVLESLQLLSLGFSPVFGYNLTGVSEISFAVWSTNIPVWDARHMGSVPIALPLAVTAVLLLISVLLLLCIVGLVTKRVERHGYVSATAAYTMQVVGSVLFFPALHMALAPMFCRDGTVYWIPEHGECWDAAHLAAVVIGIVTVLLYSAVAFCASTFLCRVANSLHAGEGDHNGCTGIDRAHPYVEVVNAVAKTALVIAFHIFVALADTKIIFSIALLLYCIIMVAMNVTYMPHHRDSITQAKVACLFVTGWAACLNIAIVGTSDTIASRQLHTVSFVATLPLVAYIGQRIALWRVSDEAKHKLAQFLERGIIPIHEARFPFPVHLLESELSRLPPKYRSLENDLLQAGPAEDGLAQRVDRFAELLDQPLLPDQAQDISEMLVPWISEVRLATDAELATRTLRRVASFVQQPASVSALCFAFRIFSKTLLLSRQAAITTVHLASLIFFHAPRQQFVLQLVDSVDMRPHDNDMYVLFMSMRLGVEVKRYFGLRDAARVETFTAAKKLHKSALTSIASFWTRLTGGVAGDLTAIIQLTNQLTALRLNAFETYQRALQSYGTDRQLLMLYSAFLNDVMLEPRAAAAVKNFAEDLAEERRSKLLGGSNRGSSAAGGELPEALNFGGDAGTSVGSSQASSQANESSSKASLRGASHRRLTPTVVVMMAGVIIAVLAGIGLFVAVAVQTTRDLTSLDAADSLGIVVGKATEATAQLDEVVYDGRASFAAASTTETTAAAGTSTDNGVASAARTQLAHDEAKFSAQMNKFVDSSTGYHALFGERLDALMFGHDTIPVDVSGTDADIVDFEQNDAFTLVSSLRASVTSGINELALSQSATYFAAYMTDNAARVATALIRAADLLYDSMEQRATVTLGVTGALLGLAAFVLALVYVSVHANLANGGNMKATVIQLFALIPLATQQALESDSRRRVEQFDQWEDEEQQSASGGEHLDLGDMAASASQEATTSAGYNRAHSINMRSMSRVSEGLDSRRVSLMTGRKRTVSGEKTRGVLVGASHYTATGRRKDIAVKKRVGFNLPQRSADDTPKKRMAEPKVLLQMTESADSAAMTGPSAKRRAKRLGKQSSHANEARDSSSSAVRMAVSCTFAILVACAGIALAAAGRQYAENSVNDVASAKELAAWSFKRFVYFSKLTDSCRRFIGFGALEPYNDFYSVVASGELEDLIVGPWTTPLMTPKIQRAATAVRSPTLTMVARQQIGMAIGALLHNVEAASVPHAALLRWKADEVSTLALSRYYKVVNVSEPDYLGHDAVRQLAARIYSANATVAERAAGQVTLKEYAVAAAAGYKTRLYEGEIRDGIIEVLRLVENRLTTWAKDTDHALRGYAGGALACACVLLASMVVSFAMMLRSTQAAHHGETLTRLRTLTLLAQKQPVELACIAFGSLATLVSVIVLAVTFAFVPDTTVAEQLMRLGVFQRNLREATSRAANFALAGDVLEAYAAVVGDSEDLTVATAPTLAENFARLLVTTDVLQDPNSVVADAVEVLDRVRNVSTTLGIHAYGVANDTAVAALFEVNAEYDIVQEPAYDDDRVTYRDDFPELRYTSLSNDLATQNATTQLLMSQHAVLGARPYRHLRSIREALADAPAKVVDLMEIEEVKSSREGLIIGAVVCFAACIVAVVLLILCTIFAALKTGTSTGVDEDLITQLFAGTIRQSVFALVLLLVIVFTQFIVFVAYHEQPRELAEVVFNAHRRAAHAADTVRQLNTLERVINSEASIVIDATALHTWRGAYGQALLAQQELCAAGTALSAAHSFVSFASIGETGEQVTATFGGAPPSLDRRLIDWNEQVSAICAMSLTVGGASNGSSLAAVEYFIDPTDKAAIGAAASTLRSSIRTLLDKIDVSTDVYKTDARTRIANPLMPSGIVLALLIIIAVLEDRLVFHPTGERLALEEAGAKLLLNMIPPAVRSVVPKIKLYLETGVIVESEAEERAHPMTCPAMSEFTANWQAGVASEEAFPLLNNSNYATVLIDGEGTMMHLNKIALDLLEYEENDVLGQNVKVLTEEPIRSLHDGFLKRYVGGGQSRLVGQKPRDVFALAKSGARKHVMVRIFEVSRKNDAFFLGLMKPYDVAAVTDDAAVSAALSAVERE